MASSSCTSCKLKTYAQHPAQSSPSMGIVQTSDRNKKVFPCCDSGKRRLGVIFNDLSLPSPQRDSALTSALLQAKKMHIYTTIAGPAWPMDLELHFQLEGPGRAPGTHPRHRAAAAATPLL